MLSILADYVMKQSLAALPEASDSNWRQWDTETKNATYIFFLINF